MRRIDALRLLALAVLGTAAALLGSRIAHRLEAGGALVLEVGRERITHVDEHTREVLNALPSRLHLTYYVSGPEHMPSHVRGVERSVTDLFEALERAAPGKVAFQIVDPSSDPDLEGFSARRRIAPFRTRSITRDAYDERTIWSSIAITSGAGGEAIVDGIVPERVPLLQRLIVEHVERLDAPRRPVLALDAPAGFEQLAAALAEKGELRRVDLAGEDPFPVEADVLFWMKPHVVAPARLAELDRFLALGRGVVVAGSALEAERSLREVSGEPALLLHAAPEGLSTLLAHFDLSPAVELVCDGKASDRIVLPGEAEGEGTPAPYSIRCIAPNQDFQGWRGQPNGNLYFDFPTPLTAGREELRDRGYDARVRATSTEETWVQAAPLDVPLPLSRISPDRGEAVAKQPLVVELEPDDPWAGRLVALAASTPFEDGSFTREGAAHRPLLRTLLNDLAAPERLALNAAMRAPAEPLPELAFGSRLLLRTVCIALFPAALLVHFLSRRRRERGASRPAAPGAPRARRVALGAGGVGLLLLGLVRLVGAAGATADLTADSRNRLAPETRVLARDVLAGNPVACELVFSARDRLPPSLRNLPSRVRAVLAALARAGVPLEVSTVDPDGRDEDRVEALAAEGIAPRRVVVRDEETTSVRRVYAALRLASGTRVEAVSLADDRALEELEFRTVFALWRLATGRRPHVAFASDNPRLSAAEAYEDFQQKGLHAPKGADVYSAARELLVASGYEVTHVDQAKPVLPGDLDALVWLQPRRSIEPMLEATVRYLHGGGHVLLAAQHFVVQSRQYRGAEFDVVHWPQPQSPDVDRFYFPGIGIQLVREVVFDERNFASVIESQVNGRGAQRQWHRHETALPYLVRAASANMDPSSPITRDLGDQAFAGPAYLRLDEERLAELGLEAHTLIRTSARSWTYEWKGGWVPPELLEGPPGAWAGRLPLAVLVEGTFPRPEAPLFPRTTAAAPAAPEPAGEEGLEGPELPPGTGPPLEEEAEEEPEAPWPDPAPGRLFFLAGSEPFRDAHLLDPEFRADHLLLNAVADLALEPELAAVAVRRRVPRGFDFVPEEERLEWRAIVVASWPALLVVGGLLRALVRRRPPRRRARA